MAFIRRSARWEVALVAALFVFVLALRLIAVSGWRIDSDEPQHLHVVWGWTQGLVQYRDYFDNHAPLFQLLCAPLVWALGERADILFWMRLAMVPFFVGSLYALGVLGRRLYRPGIVPWGVLLAAVLPMFLLTGTEFRTDDLWTLGWFATLAVFFGGELTVRRWFMSGILLGATFSTSMKTSLLMVSLLSGALPVLLWRGWREGVGFLKGLGTRIPAALAGALIVPALLACFFASRGALDELYYCVFQHNMITGSKRALHDVFAGWVVGSCVVGAGIYALSPSSFVAARRATLLISGGIYLGLLRGYWPLITDQDYLPIVPVMVVIVVSSLLEVALKVPLLAARGWMLKLACCVAVVLLGRDTARNAHLFAGSHTRLFEDGLSHLLKLAGPDDYLMDPKGETIFRHRPFYYVLEGVTKRRMRSHLIADTIREDVVRTNTCVVVYNKRIPRSHKKWLKKEYVQVARDIWVTGVLLPEGRGTQQFAIARPALYRVLGPNGPVAVTIDGQPCNGPVKLEPGEHQIATGDGGDAGPLAIVWSKTLEAGLNPFSTSDLVCTLVNDEL